MHLTLTRIYNYKVSNYCKLPEDNLIRNQVHFPNKKKEFVFFSKQGDVKNSRLLVYINNSKISYFFVN